MREYAPPLDGGQDDIAFESLRQSMEAGRGAALSEEEQEELRKIVRMKRKAGDRNLKN